MRDTDRPVMSEPPFNGNPINYPAWKANYQSNIGRNTRLTDEQKFTYLKKNLAGKPKQQMERFQHVGANLEAATRLLDAYYLNKDYRLNHLLEMIEDIDKVPNNSTERLINLNTVVTEFAHYLWKTHPKKLD